MKIANNPAITLPGIYPREMKTHSTQKLVQNVHSTYICNRQKLETAQLSLTRQTDG